LKDETIVIPYVPTMKVLVLDESIVLTFGPKMMILVLSLRYCVILEITMIFWNNPFIPY
jgi:hypothetical protein